MKIIQLSIVLLILLTSCREKIKEAFDLNLLPNDWVKLTEKDGNLIVYNSCDAGNTLLTISKNKNRFELLLHGQQEDYKFIILESTQQRDTIYLEAKWKESDDQQTFKFFWINKERGLGNFTTTYSNGYTSNDLFVTKDKEKNFEKINQPCRECWGNECDELEKQ